ncbi:hypothetical protein TNCV_388381 [Trichonephila clavipes]|nr:hypothetical protein TNCV_388381 [Trichonephila clavipes]
MSSHSSCRTALRGEDIERMDWPARSPDLNPYRACMGFSRQTLGSSYLTTSNDSGSFDWRCKTEWAAMPQQLIDTLILSMGRRCETCLAVRGDHIPY